MTDDELEKWSSERVAAIRERNSKASETKVRVVLDELVLVIVSHCATIGATEWPENLHLADVLEKHLLRQLRASAGAGWRGPA